MTQSYPNLITRQDAFDSLVADAARERRFALDTEFISERSFRPRLCLIQIAVGDVIAAVDPFEVRDLGRFLDLIVDPDVQVVLHSGQQDMMIFFDMLGEPPRNVYDTQIAAALLGHGDAIGYARLVDTCIGTRLSRDEAYTDWSLRPLTTKQVDYALDDVRHLLPLQVELNRELAALQRERWLEEELRIYSDVNFYRRNPDTLYQRFRAAGNLKPKDLRVLQELALWREDEAAERDCPRGRVVSDDTLVDLARRTPGSIKALQKMRGLHPRLVRRSGEVIVKRIRHACSQPEDTWPAVPFQIPKDPRFALLLDLLEVTLKCRAAELKISPSYIATRKQLAEMLCHFEASGKVDQDLPVMRGWRFELVGARLVQLLRGETSVTVDADQRSVRLCGGE